MRLEKKEPLMVDKVVNNWHTGRWGSEWRSIPSSLTPLLMECDRWCWSNCLIICCISALNNLEGQRTEWFCERERTKNQTLVATLNAPPWKRQLEVKGWSHTVHLSSKETTISRYGPKPTSFTYCTSQSISEERKTRWRVVPKEGTNDLKAWTKEERS